MSMSKFVDRLLHWENGFMALHAIEKDYKNIYTSCALLEKKLAQSESDK